MLTTVTITGADDRVDPEDLARLSEEFPHVEWGVLVSTSRAGTPRYPSAKWLRYLADAHRAYSMSLSAHFCGGIARSLAEGDDAACTIAEFFLAAGPFERVQLNGVFPFSRENFANLAADLWQEVIFQANGNLQLVSAQNDARAVLSAGGRASVLFDPSGGRGVETRLWPSPAPDVRMGYAGGIKPENVEDVLKEICASGSQGSWWIDMESGVRDGEDRFDLGRVRAVLERTARFVR